MNGTKWTLDGHGSTPEELWKAMNRGIEAAALPFELRARDNLHALYPFWTSPTNLWLQAPTPFRPLGAPLTAGDVGRIAIAITKERNTK